MCGPVHPRAIILSFSGEGENILLDLPLFGFQYAFSFIRRPTVLVAMPSGLFGSNDQIPDREVIRNAGISSDRFLAMGNNDSGSGFYLTHSQEADILQLRIGKRLEAHSIQYV